MKTKIAVLVFALALLISMGGVLAQETDEGEEMEATMRLMGKAEADLPDAVTKEITLPDHLLPDPSLQEDTGSPAVEASKFGLKTANDNRLRRDTELQQANDAHDNAADMADQVHENQENRGRSEQHPEPPGPPDNLGPPDAPPGG